jgi:DNA gyrase/topoisomerase IV subunit A
MAKRTTKKPDIINLDDTPDLTDFMLSAEAKTSDMFVEEFLDTFIKEYGIYVIQTRALPNIMDGLRVGARKIIYASNKHLKPGNPVKMTSLIGRVFDLAFHHGDASLQSTIEFF